MFDSIVVPKFLKVKDLPADDRQGQRVWQADNLEVGFAIMKRQQK